MFTLHKKHSLKFAVLFLLTINLTAWSSATAWDECTVDLYYDLYQAVVDIRLLTPCELPNFSQDDAYGFQESFVTRFEDELVGYKLGLTGGVGLNATEPVYGRLFRSMLRENNDNIYLCDFVKPMIELEIAFIFGNDVSYPVTLENLQASVDKVAPAVELTDMCFKNLPDLDWKDLIALNVTPRRVIIGETMDLDEVDVNKITAMAIHKGQIVSEGVAINNMWGDQWSALLFLIEKLHLRSYQIKAGDFVITGAMNSLTFIERGKYKVDYGELGMIKFKVKDRERGGKRNFGEHP
ncbi:MAG: 2-keto-4-pentenoate hydratase [Desulfobacteria bacterium]